MSSTRHSISGARQHGLASDPVYVAAQGIQGTIVTKKAGILSSAHARSLIYFLQALSLPKLAGRPNPGGLKHWVREFMAEFADRIGTPSMHHFGIKPGQVYKADQARKVRDELYALVPGISARFPIVGDTIWNWNGEEEPVENARATYPASDFVAVCAKLAEAGLSDFIIGLCTDPKMVVVAPGEATAGALVSECEIGEEWPELLGEKFDVPSLTYFRDIIGALFEFQHRFEQRVKGEFAETSIAQVVIKTLDAGLRLRRIVMINGIEGVGKSEAGRSWCARHLGEARYVDLTGINNKTSFFRSIARALGLPCSESLNTGQLQSRVEAMLERSGLMLCIDEAHFMFKRTERSKVAPGQIDWIDTALCNRGVPVGLLCTPQFLTLMNRTEEKTEWNSGQFARRLKRLPMLPARPTQADLECVACKRLPKAPARVIKLLVGYSGSQKHHHLDALIDAINEASALAGGDDAITFKHVEEVIGGVLAETAFAKSEVFGATAVRGRARKAHKASVVQHDRNEIAAPLHDEDLAAPAAQRSGFVTLPKRGGLVPA